jgi:hypothetical protein
MANEFVARKGLIVPTGSINVIAGDVTASNFLGTASVAISSSFATTASYAMNAGSGGGFPFSGSAVITGSLNVTQAVTASYFKGDGSQLTNIPPSVGQSALRVDGHQYDADGTTISYTLSQSIYNVDDLIVSVGGISYTPTVDYTVSSNILTFTEIPPSGSNITVRALVAVTSGSINVLSGSFSGSFFGTSSWANNAVTSSYSLNAGLKNKAGSVANTSFSGSPLTASVTFSSGFSNGDYAIAITGEDSRAWMIQNKTPNGFVINSVSSVALTGNTYWTCTAYGEN